MRALAPVVPQVGPADTGQHDPNDGLGRLMDHRIRPLADLDVPRSAENGSSHSYLASRAMSERFWSRDTDRSHAHQTISASGEGKHVDRGYWQNLPSRRPGYAGFRSVSREQPSAIRPGPRPAAGRGEGDEISPVELIFDLAFVFAVSQLHNICARR
jgi:hypothetical protein